MTSLRSILIAAIAGVAVVGGAAALKQNDLRLWLEGVRAVDFRNSPVQVFGTACADPQLSAAGVTSLPLRDGVYHLGQYQFELVGDVRYGDVSGHTSSGSSDKAVFVGSCSSAGQTSQVLFVYGMEDGKPTRLATTDLSNGGTTLVQSYSLSDGAIHVEANRGNPPTLTTLSYALLNGNLVNLSGSPPTQVAQVAPAADESADQENPDAGAGEDKVNYQTFHDQLAPYGQWIDHPRWGTVWHPTAVPGDFRPYHDGHWENTDEYGTVWVSDYAWGDTPFHYGRWGYDPNYGWLWVPGYTWAPAWVSWREGAGDIGWLPIPPGYYDGEGAYPEDWNAWYGYRDLYGAALDDAAFLALWSFVPADDIFAPRIGVDVIAPGAYRGFIGRTRGWTRFGMVRGHLFNRSIDAFRFRAAFGHAMPLGSRHDFAAHHGPIVSVAAGTRIGAHEAAQGHPGVSAGVGHGGIAHAGVHSSGTLAHAGIHPEGGTGIGKGIGGAQYHGSSHTTQAHGYSRSSGTEHHSASTYSRSHTGTSGYSRSATTYSHGSSSTYSRTPSGGISRTSTAGFSHTPASSGSTFSHSSYGSGQTFSHPTTGGGFTQHPTFGGGSNTFARPQPMAMPQTQRPSSSSSSSSSHRTCPHGQRC